jgi:hypothetical protein
MIPADILVVLTLLLIVVVPLMVLAGRIAAKRAREQARKAELNVLHYLGNNGQAREEKRYD